MFCMSIRIAERPRPTAKRLKSKSSVPSTHMRTYYKAGCLKGSRPPSRRGGDGQFVGISGEMLMAKLPHELAHVRCDSNGVYLDEGYDTLNPGQVRHDLVANPEFQTSNLGKSSHHGACSWNSYETLETFEKKKTRSKLTGRLKINKAIDALGGGCVAPLDYNVQLWFQHATGCGKPAAIRIAACALLNAHIACDGRLTLKVFLDVLDSIAGYTAIGPSGSLTPHNTSAMIFLHGITSALGFSEPLF